jgi:subtilase family serine protease
MRGIGDERYPFMARVQGMRRHKSSFVACAFALGLGGALLTPAGSQAAGSAASGRAVLAGTAAPAAEQAHPAGSVSSAGQIAFDVVLQLRNESGAQALLRAVSTPGSAEYRQFVSAQQWEAAFAPTQAQVNQAESWLRSAGFSVGAVPADRLVIPASGTAAQIEAAFGTHLGNYQVAGRTVRLASGDLSIPASLSGIVAGTMGINQSVAEPAAVGDADVPGSSSSSSSSASGKFPPPPSAFLPAPPCSTYFGQKTKTLTPPFDSYPTTVPVEVCGYIPGQLRSAYGVSASTLGSGARIGIVDAFGSATMAKDATQYFATNDPSYPFSLAHYKQILQMPFTQESVCGDWSTEQAIDIESAHGMAPDAHIVYVGAASCFDPPLFAAEQTLVDNHLVDVISNSWGDPAGDLLDDSSTRSAFDNLFMMAGSEGISILYASGDWDDNFYLTGISAPAFPESSPYDTAVGGTTTEIGADGQITAEYGWDTGRSIFCSANIENVWPGCTSSTLNTWLPATIDGVSGGGTSYEYAEPTWQQPVVPSDLADRNAGDTGEANRVIPDISAEADPSTGFLIGLTEVFPDGTVGYGQPRYGGTSLASPIFSGMVADAIGEANKPLGFLNPTIYSLDTSTPSSIIDILSPGKQGIWRRDYASTYISGGTGYIVSFRELYYLGPETYCDGTGECYSRQQPLREGPGYDSLTGVGAPSTTFIGDLAAAG